MNRSGPLAARRPGRVRGSVVGLLLIAAIAILVWQLDIDLFGGPGSGDGEDGESAPAEQQTQRQPIAATGPFVIEVRGSGAYVDGQGPVPRVDVVQRARTAVAGGRTVHLEITASALEPEVAALSEALSAEGVRFIAIHPEP